MDVDRVDLVRLGEDNGPGERAGENDVVEPVAFERGEELGVAKAGNVPVGVEDDDACGDGAGEAAAPDLVHAGDAAEAEPAQLIFFRPRSLPRRHC